MSAIQNPLAIRLPRRSCCVFIFGNRLKHPLFSNSLVSPTYVSHLRHLASLQKKTQAIDAPRWRIEAFMSGERLDGSPRRDAPGRLNLDAILSVCEALCMAPAIVFSIGSILCLMLPGTPRPFQADLGNVFFVCQFFLLVGAVAIGSVIRRMQWHVMCTYNGTDTALIKRIEKVEEDLRSSATMIRVLSRQLEKLGIRFRVTRKALKEPITEAANLAQRNSEATRALAEQEDILEKELGEIQKVLLAMQEQQQKQLELILAIAKAGRVLEGDRDAVANQGTAGKSGLVLENSTSIMDKKGINKIEIQTTNQNRG